MLGSVGMFIMLMPNNIITEKNFKVGWVVDAFMSILFGVLPLVLLSLPATLTDRCIQSSRDVSQ
jgi:hypothetical protein